MELYLDFAQTLIESVETDELLEADMKALPAPEKTKLQKIISVTKNALLKVIRMIKGVIDKMIGFISKNIFKKNIKTNADNKQSQKEPVIMGYDFNDLYDVDDISVVHLRTKVVLMGIVTNKDIDKMKEFDTGEMVKEYASKLKRGEKKDMTDQYLLRDSMRSKVEFRPVFTKPRTKKILDTCKKYLTEHETAINKLDDKFKNLKSLLDVEEAISTCKKIHNAVIFCAKIGIEFVQSALKQDIAVYRQLMGDTDSKTEPDIDKSKVVVEEALSFLIQ